ncbi:MAG: glycosyltransferase family 2 protein, partial [Flavobacteriaceae bacterium]|nr:glycosyltransferase family 2 protein [Flavobacteriaceae bacterium]
MKKDNKYTNLISIMLLISVSGILSLVFYYNSSSQWHLEGVSKVIAQGMLLYLLIIFARTVVLIILSFLEFFYQKKIRKPTAYPLVSIIVPCFNEEKVLKNAIKSVAQLNWPNLEVVVIDDGSKDLTLEVAKECEHKGRVRVIYQENGGKAAALNRGISEAIGEYVLCVDADSVLEKDVIERGIVFFELKPKLAAVAGSVKLGNVNNLLTKFQNLEYVIGLNF